MHENHSELEALDSKVKQEEEAYASVLAAVDALVSFPLPAEKLPEQPGWLERLNELWKGVPAPMGRGPKGRLRRWVWEIVAPSSLMTSAPKRALTGSTAAPPVP